MSRQPQATNDDTAVTGPSPSSPSPTTDCTAKIVDGLNANALSTTNEKVSGEGQPATGNQQHDQGQVQDALPMPSNAAIIDQLSIASATDSNQSLPHSNPQAGDTGINKISLEAFRPRKKEIHYLSDVFLQDFRDLLESVSDDDSDDDSDA